MNIPSPDALKVRPKLGAPQRAVVSTKLVEGQTDADFIKAIAVDATSPTDKQLIVYDAALGKYKPTSLSTLSGDVTSETIFSTSATELRAGNTTIVVGTGPPTGPSAAGDIVFSPGAIQRVEMLVNPRVGATAPLSPTAAVGGAGIPTTTQTSFAYTSAGDPFTVGRYITIAGTGEAMFITAIDTTGAGGILFVQRGRLQTSATVHSAGAGIFDVSVVSVMHVNGGMRATGGVATSDLALHGSSTQELLVKRTFTRPVPTYVGTPDGSMVLHYGEHSEAADVNFVVEIDTSGATDAGATFRWSNDGGGTWEATLQAVTQGFVYLQNGVVISWDYGTYMVGSSWAFTAVGTANQVELVRADTTADKLHIRNLNVNATSSVYGTNLSGTFVYTGASSPTGWFVTTQYEGTVDGQSSTSLQVTSIANSARDMAALFGARISIGTLVGQTGTLTSAAAQYIGSGGWVGSKPDLAFGTYIGDIGHASIGEVYGLYIDPLTGFAVYNIYQRGTTGVNRLAAPTLIGADASPATSAVLELQTTTGALLLSRLTNVQRAALTAVDGMVLYNSSTNALNVRASGAWAALSVTTHTHTPYVISNGVSGGQIIAGGTGTGEALNLADNIVDNDSVLDLTPGTATLSSATGVVVLSAAAGSVQVNTLLDLSLVAAGSPRMKILATSDTPTATWGAAAGNEVSTTPAGWLEVDVGGASRYIPFWA